jgi:hypothetical protein
MMNAPAGAMAMAGHASQSRTPLSGVTQLAIRTAIAPAEAMRIICESRRRRNGAPQGARAAIASDAN